MALGHIPKVAWAKCPDMTQCKGVPEVDACVSYYLSMSIGKA